jgi:hypothetical protein
MGGPVARHPCSISRRAWPRRPRGRVRCFLASGGLVEAIDEPGYRGEQRGGSGSRGGTQPSIEAERTAVAWRQLAVGSELVHEVVRHAALQHVARISVVQSACVAGRDRLY